MRVGLSRDVIVAEAVALADESGFDAVTLSALARRLGVQTPSLYSHVRDLAAVRDGVTAVAMRELAERIADGIAGRSGADALRGFANAHRDYCREVPGRWQALTARAGRDAVDSAAARLLVDRMRAMLRGYDLADTDAVHAIRILGSAINGFLSIESVGGFDHSDPAPETSWTRMIDGLDALLRGWHAEPHR